MLAIFFALFTMVGWATSDLAGAITSRRIGAFKATFWAYALTIPPLTLLIPFYLHDLAGATLPVVALTIGLGILSIISYIAFTEAARIGNPSVVGTIAGSFVGLVVIFSIIFLHDSLNLSQALAIIVILAGLTLTSLNFSDLRQRVFKPDRSIVLALITMISWGIYFTFIKVSVNHLGWFWPEYIATFSGAIFLLIIGARRVTLSRQQSRRGIPPAAIAAIMGGAGALAYNLALQHGHTAIVAPIAGSYPVLFVLLSSLIFKDPVSRSQRLGMAVTLTGIVALSVISA